MNQNKLATFIKQLLKVGITTHFIATLTYTSDSTINNILTGVEVKNNTLEKVSLRLGLFCDDLLSAWISANQKTHA